MCLSSPSGTVTTTGRKLDREQQEEHVLEVLVQDSPDPTLALSAKVMVIVTVLDQNDHSPAFLRETYDFTIPSTAGRAYWEGQTLTETETVVGQVNYC